MCKKTIVVKKTGLILTPFFLRIFSNISKKIKNQNIKKNN